jgi:peroxiredoxin
VPHLKELYERFKDEGLVIVAVHTQNGAERAADFVREQGIEYPVALDHEGRTVQRFAVDSFPDYYLIDRAGNLRVADLANGDLDRVIEALLAEPEPE